MAAAPYTYNEKSPALKQPRFDLESIISNYKGRTIFQRLLLIGVNSTVIGVGALKAAINDAKNNKDIQRYLGAQSVLETVAPHEPEAKKDTEWITYMEKKVQVETQRLETELKQYKNNLIKESIRIGNEDLGKHYQAIGDLNKAYDAFSRMRQEANLPKHILDVSCHLIEVSLEQKNWISVISNIQKIKQVVSTSDEDRALQPLLCAVEGIANLDAGKFLNAATCFLNAESGMGQKFNTILIANDIAIYGGLCALATLERKELETKVLRNSNFRTYLELEPHIRRAITYFINGRYSDCLNILQTYHTDYYLDIYLHNHIDEIYYLIRKKSIVHYLIPFSCVSVDSLAKVFVSPGQDIEKELISMIKSEDINARIDTQNRLLISIPSLPRQSLQKYTLEMAKSYENEALLRLQHINICSAELEVKCPSPDTTMMDDGFDDNIC
ncbi:COP9 signalosome complex subunit 1 [Erysiphe necator]|uniref:Putative cop9 signalosome subunit 1 protein n=1 Tax=Uncinula necator TaxID=52586 RepID=A0A0B1P0M0_UNCNE|nr:COP9 signalosome complex subunit 1 [Erysiphe necator]KHJ30805.1 putative cop9 signalosome subunit 1 protein [Erysiphe necator]